MRLRCQSPAKINLGLEILGKRPDGYHEIRSILQMIDLQDEVHVAESDSMRLTCSDLTLAGADNLALRAAQLWSAGIDPQHRSLEIKLIKHIPAAAGLGGASSNAASVLILANQLASFADSRNVPAQAISIQTRLEQLHDIAAQLGSDVPFFLGGSASFVSGRGELLEPVSPLYAAWIVLVTPTIKIERKTARMYAALEPERDFSDGSIVEETRCKLAAAAPLAGPDLFNAFARPLRALYPELERIVEIMGFYADGRFGLSGAGPTWYALVESRASAELLAERFARELPTARIVTARPLTGPIRVHVDANE